MIYKIIKGNKLGIPIGTKLHSSSFFDKPKRFSASWDSVSVYNYQDNEGKLYCINQSQFDCLFGTYVNCIIVNWTYEFLVEGDTYWKVFTTEQAAYYHKLEFDGKKHSSALLLKPYKDIVYSNTNVNPNIGLQRFSTLELAEKYCDAVRNGINFHDIINKMK